ncbi:surfeit locus protein 6 [Sturnira hondurensis]|uniref:surfeit locus protein 6 n=1 Tax=Sturnira hondurensis TaxID=192404 RepID=UPI00187A23A9|nr:surfeit locus protein 6 [Sturnira hondurensis]XP_036892528.1 surfeit locus protein 6 [Sturnira hondurensis]XP_036892529.1 surfeit locus protein 6 [Sturnira hondurensis]
MASLLAKDAYLQNLARKICSGPSPEPQKRKSALKTQGSEATGPPKKKRKRAQKKSQGQEKKVVEPKAQALGEKAWGPSRAPAGGMAAEPESFFALDVLRQRLHEKIREARGQGSTEELSPTALEKRRRRKQERDRKKRKRKELRAREKVAKGAEAAEAAEAAVVPLSEETPGKPALLFNKVEVSEEPPASRAQRRREKRQRLKGNLPPLTGKNYRQLLERLQARQNQLETLRGQDAGKAQELESKIQWTAALYRAEGVRIRDDERLLQAALRRKEKRRAQRQRRWEKRTAHVVEKMQRRQDQRRQNLRKKKVAKAERRKEKARRKGRVLPQDLQRAGLA